MKHRHFKQSRKSFITYAIIAIKTL